MLHIRQICIDDNGRVSCFSITDPFEVNRLKNDSDIEHVIRFLKTMNETDVDADGDIMLKLNHENALLATELLKETERVQADHEELKELTPREREVLHLLCTGLTNNQIATTLNVKLTTVKTYVRTIYDKLNIHRRAKIVRIGQQMQW